MTRVVKKWRLQWPDNEWERMEHRKRFNVHKSAVGRTQRGDKAMTLFRQERELVISACRMWARNRAKL